MVKGKRQALFIEREDGIYVYTNYKPKAFRNMLRRCLRQSKEED